VTFVFSISGDADGLRACEGRHAVEHACTNRYFGYVGADLASPQAGARKDLEPVHQSRGQRAPVVATRQRPFTESEQKLGRRPRTAAFASCRGASVSMEYATRSRSAGSQSHAVDHRSKVDDESDPVEEGDGVLAIVERPDRSLAELGLTLTEGRSLLAKVQTKLTSLQDLANPSG